MTQRAAFRLIGFACWLLSSRPRGPFWAHDLTKIGRNIYLLASDVMQQRMAKAKSERPSKRRRVA